MYTIKYSRDAKKDTKKLSSAKLTNKAKQLIETIRVDPFAAPPPCEKLTDRIETYSRRINQKHRLVYEVDKKERIVYVLRMWTHYE